MTKIPTETDLFAQDDPREEWIGEARHAQFKLEAVRNSYVGNKRKMLVDFAAILYDVGLHEKIISGAKVLDLFSGSAFVGYFFKRMGASVWSNELLLSSYLNSLILVEADGHSLGNEQLRWLLEPHAECSYSPGVAAKYVGTRFTQAEAEALDRFATNVQWEYGWTLNEVLTGFHGSLDEKISGYYNGCSTPSGSTLKFHYEAANAAMSILHMVMNRCYVGGRLNSGQVLAKLEHRLNHQRNEGSEGIPFHAVSPYTLSFSNGRNCIASNLDAMELLAAYKPNVDIIYIDPPYGGDQSDYAEMYEFFEEFVGCSRPPAADRFVKSKTYSQQFDELLQALPKEPVWIFSYNDDSWANIDEITAHLRPFGRREIIVKEVDYRYNYRSKEKAGGTEYVIVAVP